MTASRKYYIRYSVEAVPEGFIPDRATLPPGGGACDAIVFLSCISHEDGSYSQLNMARDGRTGEKMSAKDLWKAWSLLACELGKRKDLDEGRRAVAQTAWEVVCAGMKAMTSRS